MQEFSPREKARVKKYFLACRVQMFVNLRAFETTILNVFRARFFFCGNCLKVLQKLQRTGVSLAVRERPIIEGPSASNSLKIKTL